MALAPCAVRSGFGIIYFLTLMRFCVVLAVSVCFLKSFEEIPQGIVCLFQLTRELGTVEAEQLRNGQNAP